MQSNIVNLEKEEAIVGLGLEKAAGNVTQNQIGFDNFQFTVSSDSSSSSSSYSDQDTPFKAPFSLGMFEKPSGDSSKNKQKANKNRDAALLYGTKKTILKNGEVLNVAPGEIFSDIEPFYFSSEGIQLCNLKIGYKPPGYSSDGYSPVVLTIMNKDGKLYTTHQYVYSEGEKKFSPESLDVHCAKRRSFQHPAGFSQKQKTHTNKNPMNGQKVKVEKSTPHAVVVPEKLEDEHFILRSEILELKGFLLAQQAQQLVLKDSLSGLLKRQINFEESMSETFAKHSSLRENHSDGCSKPGLDVNSNTIAVLEQKVKNDVDVASTKLYLNIYAVILLFASICFLFVIKA